MKILLSFVLLVSSALALPSSDVSARAKKPTCFTRSSRVREWTVHDFDYHASYIFSTPSHQIPGGYVNFTLENPALGYRPVCSSSSIRLEDFYYGEVTYKCKVPNKKDTATYTFSRPSGELKIEQTWRCKDGGAKFEAKGKTKLKLDCKETKWVNPNWKLGETYSTRFIKCKHVTVKVPIDLTTAIL